ncbi:MAG TPA: hypothetical protein PK970_13550, partial [Hyphomicrobiaceae bacterium]|nr:hypothetical protein [Hyphomicrobiaceae bacterium]
MAANDWANTRASRMNDTQDSNMDEILASIRRIIAEDPIGSRPNPSTIHETSSNTGPALPLPQRGEKRSDQRVEPTLPPLRGPATQSRSATSPPPATPLPRNAADIGSITETASDLDDIFETSPTPAPRAVPPLATAIPADAPSLEMSVPSPPVSRFATRAERMRSTVPPPPSLAEPAAVEVQATAKPTLPGPLPSPVAHAAEAPADTSGPEPVSSGPVTIASTPTNDADVENLLSRLAASLSAQASIAPSDELARKTVADAVTAVAAANTQIQETPTEPVFEIIAESRPMSVEPDVPVASRETATSERPSLIAPLASTVPPPAAFEPGNADGAPVTQPSVAPEPVAAADPVRTPP